MPRKITAQSGFSMIELLIAVVILAVGLLGLAELQVTAINANAQSSSIDVANALAQKAIEDIAAMSADEPIFAANVTGAPWKDGSYDIEGAGTYNITYDLTTNFGSVTGLSRIIVHVRSAGDVSNVLGHRTRSVNAVTFKRSF